ncbi:DUF624 domain-containing protein [Bacillus sp. JJ1533]|uniref:YesL family protein n=1 Tax=Bacillus sp. JJ1533 TaxID=3122959 RepID=UPI002FFF0895
MKGLMQGFYTLCEWVMRLAFLNILWVLFSLLGGIVFGIFPSTVAMFDISKKWLKGETGLPIFIHYWQTFKKCFIKGNTLGLLLTVIGIVLYVDFNLFINFDSMPFMILSVLAIIAILLYCLLLVYIFPIFVSYEVSILHCLKFATLIGVYKPISTFSIICAGILLYLLFSTFPPVFFFFGASITSYVIMWISQNAILNIKNTVKNYPSGEMVKANAKISSS